MNECDRPAHAPATDVEAQLRSAVERNAPHHCSYLSLDFRCFGVLTSPSVSHSLITVVYRKKGKFHLAEKAKSSPAFRRKNLRHAPPSAGVVTLRSRHPCLWLPMVAPG